MSKDAPKPRSIKSRESFELVNCGKAVLFATTAANISTCVGGVVGKRYYGNVVEHQLEALRRMIGELGHLTHEAGVDAEVSGRIKSFDSIWRKMRDRGMFYREVSDAVGVRVLVQSEDDCYRLIETIESRFEPVYGRRRDYIAVPKDNGYRSLHTTVRDDRRVPIEIQLRTYGMHRNSEHGPAAHRQYKREQRSVVQREPLVQDDA